VGDQPGQAEALNELGFLQVLTGDYPAAAASHQQALGSWCFSRVAVCQVR
jgi:hypothetical protein